MTRYGYPQIMLAERGRVMLGYFVLFSCLCAGVSGVLFIAFSFIGLGVIDPYTKVLKGYSGAPYFIIYWISGTSQVVLNFGSAYVFKVASQVITRPNLKIVSSKLGIIWMVHTIGTAMILVACGASVGVQIAKLNNALNHGISEIMNAYGDGQEPKVVMDRIQLDFGCCGNNGVNDWFTTQWQLLDDLRQTDLERIKSDDPKEYHVANAPFSCCDPESTITPCQHLSITDMDVHSQLYNTLHEDGCRVAMLDYFKSALLVPAGGFVGVVGFVGIMNMVLTRILQTSIDNIEWACPEHPGGVSPGYLIPKPEKKAKKGKSQQFQYWQNPQKPEKPPKVPQPEKPLQAPQPPPTAPQAPAAWLKPPKQEKPPKVPKSKQTSQPPLAAPPAAPLASPARPKPPRPPKLAALKQKKLP